MTPERKSLMVWGSFFLLTIAWGSSFILIKRSLQGGFEPFEVAMIRMIAAASVLIIPALLYFPKIPRNQLPYMTVSGWISMLIPAFLFSTAQVHISSSVASVLNALTPAFTFIVGVLVFGQLAKKMQVLGLLIGFTGSIVLILVNAKGQFNINHFAILPLVATLLYGINVNMVKHKLVGARPAHISSIAVCASGVTAAVLLLLSGKLPHVVDIAAANPWALVANIMLGAMGTAFATVVFNYMLTLTSSVFASSITYFIPIVGILWGVWDGETLHYWHYLGISFIIGGVLILNRSR
jgi:drug/metabolite transporter (DMT)-like permease